MRIGTTVLLGLVVAVAAGCACPEPSRIEPPRAMFDGPGATSKAVPKERAMSLTVHEAVTEALGSNRSIRTARRLEIRGREDVSQALALMLPRVDWAAKYVRYDERAYLGPIPVGPRSKVESTLSISAPLFASGRFLENYRAAKLAESRLGVEVRVTEADIADAVTAVAYDYLEALESVGVAKATEAALEVQAQDARSMLEAGKVTKSAVLEAEVEHARARRDRERFESLVPLRRVQLNVLMGRPAGMPTEIVDAPVAEPFVIPLAQVEADALAKRPEVLAATLDLQRARRTTRSVIGGELPELRAFGSYTATDDDYATSKGQGVLGLTLSIPIFEGGAKWSRIAAAREAERISAIAREDVIANIRAEVVAAHRQVVETYKDIDVATQSVAKAKESLDVQRLKFKAGRTTSREVLDSTSLLTRSRFDRVRALYSYNVALQSLHRVRGGDPRLPPEGAGGGR